MSQAWERLGARDADSGLVNVIVETPAGSRNKYKFDERLGLFRLHKVLPVGAAFPFDFGFVPGTAADDGDPLDVVILGEEPTFPGGLVTVRVLGVVEAKQTEKGRTIRNDRLIATAETPKIKPRERTLRDVPAKLLEQIEQFFVAYNRAEGRVFVPLGRRGARAASLTIDQAIARYPAARGRS
jgi:inorganic pyrophosphatase